MQLKTKMLISCAVTVRLCLRKCTGWFVSDLVGSLEDSFSCVKAKKIHGGIRSYI